MYSPYSFPGALPLTAFDLKNSGPSPSQLREPHPSATLLPVILRISGSVSTVMMIRSDKRELTPGVMSTPVNIQES